MQEWLEKNTSHCVNYVKLHFSSRHNRLPAHHDLPICIYIALRDDVTSLIILHANRERMQTSSQIFLLTCPPCTITIYRARFVRCAFCFSYILHVWTYTSISEYVHHIVYERSGSLWVCGCSVWAYRTHFYLCENVPIGFANTFFYSPRQNANVCASACTNLAYWRAESEQPSNHMSLAYTSVQRAHTFDTWRFANVTL